MDESIIRSHHARRTLRIVSSLLDDQSLALLDVGSAGGIEPRWNQISRRIHYVGLEPDSRSNAIADRNARSFASYELVPAAAWSHDGELSIHICRKAEVCSHYAPNAELVGRFPRAERFDVLHTATVSARRLDSLALDRCDFVKLDVQGGELAALQGGDFLLSKVLGLEVEVEFLQIYREQPLFGHVAEFLAARGFEFIDFTTLHRWDRINRSGTGQCVFADALFLQTPERIRRRFDEEALSIADVRRYLAILALYRRVDLMAAFEELFRDVLGQQPDLERDLRAAVRSLTRDLRWARRLLGLARGLLKTVGNDMRPQFTY